MQLPQPFLASQVEPSGGDFVVLPRAWYPLVITGEAVEPSQNNPESGVLKFTLTVQNGHPLAGQSCRTNLNLFNVNPEAVEIAKRELSSIVRAVGLKDTPIHKTEQLFNIPFVGEYGPQKASEKYGQLFSCKSMADGIGHLAYLQTKIANPTQASPAFVPPAAPVPSLAPAWNTTAPVATAPPVATVTSPSSPPAWGAPAAMPPPTQASGAPRPPWMK